MGAKIEIKGMNKLRNALRGFDKVAQQGEARALIQAHNFMRNHIVKNMTQAKSGRQYRRGGITHRASAPGQAPARDTGNLVNSISTSPDIRAGMLGRVLLFFTVATKYAAALEFGSRKRNIEQRPFMRPAIDALKVRLVGMMKEEIRSAIKVRMKK